MAKPTQPTNVLSEAEKRDLIQLIQADKPLPEKYRFLLFEDKREVELVWNGKTADVCNAVLPFQTLEHIDEPREETRVQSDLFDARGRQKGGWTNKLIWGDNKLILSSLKSGALRRQIEEAGGLKLIYIDPPFDVGADFSMDIEIGGETFHKEPNLLEQIAYRDTWGKGADSFISMLYERLILMRDLLAKEGSIYVHCDWRVNSFIRLAMNEVFGTENFINEITWKRANTVKGNIGQGSKFMGANTDSLLAYSKSESYIFNNIFTPYSDDYIESFFKYKDSDTGRRYRLTSMIGPGGAAKGNPSYEVMGVTRYWRYSKGTMNDLISKGMIVQTAPGTVPQKKQYLDEGSGVSMQSLWDDIGGLGAASREGTKYPTQKPEALLDRIIKTSSQEGDLVADFFVGSGTTAASAEKLGRKWIASDLGKFGVHTTRKRLIGVQRELKAADKPFRAFEVLNLGRYERQAYLNVGGRLTGEQREAALSEREREFRELILRAYRAEPFENDEFFDGKQAARLVVIGPINLPVGRLFVEEVITECRKRRATRVDILAFEFEMGLFPAVLSEAREKGIDLTPKYIPAEVFDKQAIKRNQVVFHDISFVEATPRYDKKRKQTVRIELTDFSVYYSQNAAEKAIEAMKSNKSEVICDRGQLVKVSKDKQGVVSREVLTRRWTDWVDYWAVDFDYQSRKEIIKVPVGSGTSGVLSGFEAPQNEFDLDFEDRWTGSYIFENEWQSFRTRKDRELELTTAEHRYEKPGRYTVAVKVVDIFGNDTMTLVPVSVG
ncbi:DNA methyltransferase [Salinisphaera aquimarina]|uniref:site-specific DNA-methyltransferase (adenine-specific) n=1 Tax=Salinisphaera aquimarina TaxID=2094031 RepID=A0ABV7EWG7_9GAMM